MNHRLCIALILLTSFLEATPVVTSVSPLSGSSQGGDLLTITGSGFTTATSVQFGRQSVTPTIVNDSTITLTNPANVPGAVDVIVSDGVNSSPIVRGDIFTYTGRWSYDVTAGTSDGFLFSLPVPGTRFGFLGVDVGFEPNALAFTPNGRYAIVPSGGGNFTYVVDLASNSIVTTVASPAGLNDPTTVAVSQDGLYAYIGSGLSTAVGILDLSTFTFQPSLLTVPVPPTILALTPDGTKLYVSNAGSNTVFSVTIASGVSEPVRDPFPSPLNASFSTPTAFAIDPTGTTLYVTCQGTANVVQVDISSNRLLATSFSVPNSPTDISINSTGSQLAVGSTTGDLYTIDPASGVTTTAPAVSPSAIRAVNFTPDSELAYFLPSFANPIEIVDTTNNTVTQGPSTFPTNNAAAMSPDQAPVAYFTATVSQTGLSASFDGSASISPVGTITDYAWNFGDGSTGTGETTSHTYAAPGSYTVTLTVTNSAGTSSTTISTGKQVMNNGNSYAVLSQNIIVAGPSTSISAPRSFTGKIKKKGSRLELKSSWSSVTGAEAYNIYEDNRLIARVTKSSFKKTLRPGKVLKKHTKAYKKWLKKRYSIRAVDASNNTSLPIKIKVQ